MHSRSRTDAFIRSECLCSPFGWDFAEFKPLYIYFFFTTSEGPRQFGCRRSNNSRTHGNFLFAALRDESCKLYSHCGHSLHICVGLCSQTSSFSNSVLNTVTAFSKQPVPLVSWSAVDRLAEVQQGPGLVSDDEMGKISSGDRYSTTLMLTDWGLLLQDWRDACMHRYVDIPLQHSQSAPQTHIHLVPPGTVTHTHTHTHTHRLRTSTVSLLSVSQRLGCSDEGPHSPLVVKGEKKKKFVN